MLCWGCTPQLINHVEGVFQEQNPISLMGVSSHIDHTPSQSLRVPKCELNYLCCWAGSLFFGSTLKFCGRNFCEVCFFYIHHSVLVHEFLSLCDCVCLCLCMCVCACVCGYTHILSINGACLPCSCTQVVVKGRL